MGPRLHDARKAAKRVRYAAQPLEPLDRKKAKRFVRAVKKLQSVLGDHQDSAAAQEELCRLSDRAAAEGVTPSPSAAFTNVRAQRAALSRSQLRSDWDRDLRKRFRAWLS